MMTPLNGLRRVGDITGTSVKNRRGEKLGFIYDLMISEEGCVKYAILSYGARFLGIGDRLIPVPWRMLMESAHTVVIDLERRILDTAPSFGPNNWPLMSESEWQDTVEKHFEQRQETWTEDQSQAVDAEQHRRDIPLEEEPEHVRPDSGDRPVTH
ncbi:MAG TPA: PRC-barrel domain-containing protein [Desulfomonilaceae bacterium]|nr:PRC-barrel domain-containing protein [Desulfomonilaceae bacterium]